ncbi:hypothetical protein ACFLIN_00570 [Corynebacterium kutscheri]|uniref:hypothetical protein n=1 Tax=Corynebacterium kutscheri TaxID=35755 RepID=UPI0006230879|nr:hypothetical protein [Corynebacterium kutscheri]
MTNKKKALIISTVATDIVLKATAWHFLYHLPAEKIRGRKPLWAAVTTICGTVGPLAFLFYGINS